MCRLEWRESRLYVHKPFRRFTATIQEEVCILDGVDGNGETEEEWKDSNDG